MMKFPRYGNNWKYMVGISWCFIPPKNMQKCFSKHMLEAIREGWLQQTMQNYHDENHGIEIGNDKININISTITSTITSNCWFYPHFFSVAHTWDAHRRRVSAADIGAELWTWRHGM
jgi:hypothetical protein